MSRRWMLLGVTLLCSLVVAGCCRCRCGSRGGFFAPCACGYTYPHFVAPSYGPPNDGSHIAPANHPYGGGPPPMIEGTAVPPSYIPPSTGPTIPGGPSLTPAPSSVLNMSPAPASG